MPTETHPRTPPAEPPVLDGDSLLARLNGNRRLLAQVIAVFRQECPDRLELIAAGVRERDAEKVWWEARGLRVTLDNLSAVAASQAARGLELLACAGDLAGAEAAYAALEGAVRDLETALAALGPQGATNRQEIR